MLNDLIDFLVKLVPIAGLVIAGMGLNTWRRQIKGTDKYKVASELMLQAFRVREGIRVVRTPLIEYVPASDESSDKEMNHFLGYAEALGRRWKGLIDASSEFSLAALKAEVHLGKDIKNIADELLKLIRELQVSYEMHIDMKRPGSGFEDDEFNKENRKVLFAKPKDDDYFDSVNETINKLEVKTKKYL